MTNETIADRLALYALCLEVAEVDAFRVRSYQNAARRLAAARADVATLARAGRVTELEGIGTGIGEKIVTLVETGTLPEIEALRARLPEGVIALMRRPELGARRALTLYAELGIDSPAALEQAAREGRIARLEGFGARTEARLLAAAERAREAAGRVRLDVADALAERILAAIPLREGETIQPTGPARRRCPIVDRLEFVARSRRSASLLDAFVAGPGVASVRARDDVSARVLLDAGVEATLTLTKSADGHAAALVETTGSAAHVDFLRARGPIAGRSEAAIYARLDLPFVPPEQREAEHLAALETGAGPARSLLRRTDLRGLVHVHSTWSDGRATITDSARVAGELGASYVVICDHGPAARYANGMTPARIRLQRAEIDALNAAGSRVRVVAGIEVDILADGRPDLDDETLAGFEVVVASIHGGGARDEAAVFARLERALASPRVHILGHPTGRYLLEREPYLRDTERLVDLCIARGVAIEINALPKRLDLDWRAVSYGRARGARFVVSSDAHAVGDLARTDYGVDVARKGGLGPDDVLNTRACDAFLAELRAMKGAAA